MIGLILSLFLISFVSAEDNPLVGISEKGVNYDKKILDNFNFTDTEKDYFIKGDLSKIHSEGIEWVHVTVDIKDTANIIIPHRTNPDFESKIQQRTEILSEISGSILSTLLEGEFQLEGELISGRGFYGNITKEGFNKLLNDERVKKIYADKEIYGQSGTIARSFSIYILPMILLVILIIFLTKLKKELWKTKKKSK